jgi:membrane protease YdiL (CAAX protease family)
MSERSAAAARSGKSPGVHEAAAVAFLAAANVILNRTVRGPFAVPAGLATGAIAVLLGARAGASLREQGLSLEAAPRGVRVGLYAGLPIALIVGLGAFLPPTGRFFRDVGIPQATRRKAAYEVFVRIPLATSVGEELMFRSALEGILVQTRSPLRASLISAVLFGAWHILPTLDRMHSNRGLNPAQGRGVGRRAAVVVGTVGITAAASLGLSWLRRYSGSVIAPVLVHYGINAGGFGGGWLASRREARPNR